MLAMPTPLAGDMDNDRGTLGERPRGGRVNADLTFRELAKRRYFAWRRADG